MQVNPSGGDRFSERVPPSNKDPQAAFDPNQLALQFIKETAEAIQKMSDQQRKEFQADTQKAADLAQSLSLHDEPHHSQARNLIMMLSMTLADLAASNDATLKQIGIGSQQVQELSNTLSQSHQANMTALQNAASEAANRGSSDNGALNTILAAINAINANYQQQSGQAQSSASGLTGAAASISQQTQSDVSQFQQLLQMLPQILAQAARTLNA
jgi:hypothetical protein